MDDSLNPLQMRRQRATVGLAGPLTIGVGDYRLAGGAGFVKGRLDIFQPKFESVGLAPESVTHLQISNQLHSLNP